MINLTGTASTTLGGITTGGADMRFREVFGSTTSVFFDITDVQIVEVPTPNGLTLAMACTGVIGVRRRRRVALTTRPG